MEKPREAIECYDCGCNFTKKYSNPPNNLTTKHVDKRIRGKNDTDQILYDISFAQV